MPKNTTFVLTHGLGQSPSSWKNVISCLPQDMQTYCPNLCSLVVGNRITYKNLYKSFEKYCTSISGRIALCGVLLGAILAMNYAFDYPEKVESLALIAPQYKMPRVLLNLQTVLFRFMSPKNFQVGFNKEQTICLTHTMRTF